MYKNTRHFRILAVCMALMAAVSLHGQTKSITGPGFSQNLYYADGPGTKLYNGSVSAMTWTMGTDQTVRGYKYTYNGYGCLSLPGNSHRGCFATA